MPIEIFIIAVAVGIAPLVAWGLKGSKGAWVFLVMLLLMTVFSAMILYSTGQFTIKTGFDQILRLVGVILLAPGILIFVITGHEHHRRSGNPPLTPTFEPMDPDLMKKSNFGCLFVVLGGILLLLSWLLPNRTTLREEWFYFAKNVLEYGRDNNVTAMVTELSLNDPDLGEEVMNKLVKANPNLEYRPPTKPTNQDEINSAYQEEVEIFIRSYQDLFGGQLSCVTSPLKDFKGIDSYSVIIWVKKDEKTYGIKIDDVFRTSKGLKVNSWIGSRGYPTTPGSQLRKKRALIEDEECRHPNTIQYEYEYVQ
jgi:multisubunit Na+/H+ antiporter MnhB subunit